MKIIQFHVRENLGAFGGPFLGPLCSPKIGGDVILYLGFSFLVKTGSIFGSVWRPRF